METETYTRKMASIQEVNGIYPIEGADKICQFGINGWKVVDQVGKYKVGDLVVFCEVDSFIPTAVAPFLTKPGKFPKVYNEVEGEKLRTIRLRKSLSQGLLLPPNIIPGNTAVGGYEVGDDVSEILGIQKWEPPPEFTSADARGTFPSWGHKTDQCRIQNLTKEFVDYYNQDIKFEVTEKCDGSSISIGKYFDEFVVCSRNLSLKLDVTNTYVKVASKHDLENKISKNMLISGEMLGPGIQGNSYHLSDHDFWVFDVYDTDTRSYMAESDRIAICKEMKLNHVPVLYRNKTLKELGLHSIDDILKFAEGKSVMGTIDTQREGLVFKSMCGTFSFKAISNLWLLNSPIE